MVHNASPTIKKEFYDKLNTDKIRIQWNKNPIEMKLFLSFLTVDMTRSSNHLGSSNGWTKLENSEIKLVVGGGIVNGKEWLDTIQYGVKLSNPYNNNVNPFYLFDIMSKEGRSFFVDYYKEEIEEIISRQKYYISSLKNDVRKAESLLEELVKEQTEIGLANEEQMQTV